MDHNISQSQMKDFKDYTLEDFANPALFEYMSMKNHPRTTKRVAHCGLFRLVNKGAIDNSKVTIGALTEDLINVPTVSRQR